MMLSLPTDEVFALKNGKWESVMIMSGRITQSDIDTVLKYNKNVDAIKYHNEIVWKK